MTGQQRLLMDIVHFKLSVPTKIMITLDKQMVYGHIKDAIGLYKVDEEWSRWHLEWARRLFND